MFLNEVFIRLTRILRVNSFKDFIFLYHLIQLFNKPFKMF